MSALVRMSAIVHSPEGTLLLLREGRSRGGAALRFCSMAGRARIGSPLGGDRRMIP
jgi:hypothetical protein